MTPEIMAVVTAGCIALIVVIGIWCALGSVDKILADRWEDEE